MDDHGRSSSSNQPILYVLDTNVLIHDPNALLNFEEHHVAIPMTVLEELDKLKSGHHSVAAECRQAIRLIDKTLGDASPEDVELGVPIQRGKSGPKGLLSILMSKRAEPNIILPEHLNDNIIINQLIDLHAREPKLPVVLVTKDINMRLKARACGIAAEDYSTDQLVDDVSLLPNGYHNMTGSFWDRVRNVETRQDHGRTWHQVQLIDNLPAVHINEFIIDEQGFVGWIKEIEEDRLLILDLHQEPLLHQEAWGLKPRDIYQSLALYALLDPDIHLVNLSGAAGSGKTILALAAAIEQTMVSKRYRRIIATRSVQGLDQEIGFLPGTEAEKMEPWLGAITDNLEALHMDDENTHGSVDYILSKVPLQFKSLNYIRGRSFQQSLILIDECQNLTPHQMKTIITRAGAGSKVVCLGNLAQIDTPYLSATSSGLTYLTERFKDFPNGVHITLQGPFIQ
ncbi:ribonuclease [Pseudomonas sp. GW456-12-10-14-TSB6]|uniref:PhoH family protein n=1 Tax=Pseudomonas sp. GW456-12-10-14-TSB6 TaxID=2751351 RepID=UPI000C88AE56|nr:PhoH family protein [Pseudomonas sp. GW456-12-10-14-TSB6]PNA64340.1 ribonuclease [Pseudomonas sp. GW456-12-10-14-TSB6]